MSICCTVEQPGKKSGRPDHASPIQRIRVPNTSEETEYKTEATACQPSETQATNTRSNAPSAPETTETRDFGDLSASAAES